MCICCYEKATSLLPKSALSALAEMRQDDEEEEEEEEEVEGEEGEEDMWSDVETFVIGDQVCLSLSFHPSIPPSLPPSFLLTY